MRTIHVIITGVVQGVGYRAWAENEAGSRQLNGWARNRWDGSVEAVFFGDDAVVAAMVRACWDGPAMASVKSVTVSDWTGETPAVFKVLPTV